MQWSNDPNAGFTTSTPWNAIPETYKTYNVADELKDPNSILNWYKQLLALRRSNSALLDGDYLALNEKDPNVLSYVRKTATDAVIVVINISPAPQSVNFKLSKQRLSVKSAKTLLTTQPSLQNNSSVAQLSLEPFAVYIASLQK
jgi:alpha-glucosidase